MGLKDIPFALAIHVSQQSDPGSDQTVVLTTRSTHGIYLPVRTRQLSDRKMAHHLSQQLTLPSVPMSSLAPLFSLRDVLLLLFNGRPIFDDDYYSPWGYTVFFYADGQFFALSWSFEVAVANATVMNRFWYMPFARPPFRRQKRRPSPIRVPMRDWLPRLEYVDQSIERMDAWIRCMLSFVQREDAEYNPANGFLLGHLKYLGSLMAPQDLFLANFREICLSIAGLHYPERATGPEILQWIRNLSDEEVLWFRCFTSLIGHMLQCSTNCGDSKISDGGVRLTTMGLSRHAELLLLTEDVWPLIKIFNEEMGNGCDLRRDRNQLRADTVHLGTQPPLVDVRKRPAQSSVGEVGSCLNLNGEANAT